MIRYQKLQGVEISNPKLPGISITPEGRAMGAVPGWSTLLDPDYVTDNKIRNRAIPNTLQENVDTSYPDISTFANGETAFDFGDDNQRSYGSSDINPNAWTVWVVQRPDATVAPREIIRNRSSVSGGVGIRCGINAIGARASIYVNSPGTDLRLGYTPEVDYLNRTVLLMYTFSVEHGLAIYENGELCATAPDDKRPLDGAYNSGEYEWNARMNGLVGMSGLLNIDLHAPENAGYRRAIERFLMAKYGISGAA